MGIEIKITADTADEMRSEMRRLLGGDPMHVEHRFSHVMAHSPPTADTFADMKPAGIAVVGTMPPPVAPLLPVEEPEPPKRGRPRGSTKAALAAAEAAAPQPFVVRRYGGHIDSEHETPFCAYDRLCELMRDAADVAALDAVLTVNEALSEALPAERTNQITALAEQLRASLSAPTEDEPPPPPVSVEPEVKALLDLDKKPLTAITLNRRGAQNGISAIVQRFGMVKAVNVLEKMEISKVSDITDDADPRLATLATEAAAMLGLPTVAA